MGLPRFSADRLRSLRQDLKLLIEADATVDDVTATLDGWISFGYETFRGGSKWDDGKLVLTCAAVAATSAITRAPALAAAAMATLDRLFGYLSSGALYEGYSGELSGGELLQEAERCFNALQPIAPAEFVSRWDGFFEWRDSFFQSHHDIHPWPLEKRPPT